MNPNQERDVDPHAAVTATRSDEGAIRLVAEEAHVTKRLVETDRLRVSTHTDLVEEHVSQTQRTDEVEVSRVPINRTLVAGEVAPSVRTEGDVTIIPIFEEIVLVEKRIVLKEEIHIRRDTTTERVEVPVQLRKQRAVVERTSADGQAVGDNSGENDGIT